MASTQGSSPHTRGAHRSMDGQTRGRRIIPAYAGSTSRRLETASFKRDHPRIRGEHAWGYPKLCSGTGSSPHTRGARRLGVPGALDCRIIPAYAGSTSPSPRPRTGSRDHPRIRGEHWRSASKRPRIPGSSPHTRGAHHRLHRHAHRMGIIPAYAGSTLEESPDRHRDRDHPRIRGEHAAEAFGFTYTERIIPAYAGSTSCANGTSNTPADHPRIRGEHAHRSPPFHYAATDHPRIRGEHSSRAQPGHPAGGSSPHTRGARRPGRGRAGRWRIIPAYAGSTPRSPEDRRRRPDHPRIRGEHPAPFSSMRGPGGSSPHTRGARRQHGG